MFGRPVVASLRQESCAFLLRPGPAPPPAGRDRGRERSPAWRRACSRDSRQRWRPGSSRPSRPRAAGSAPGSAAASAPDPRASPAPCARSWRPAPRGQHQVVVSSHQLVGEHCGIAVGRCQALADHENRQRIAHQPDHRRDMGLLPVLEARAREPVRRDQHELVDAVGMQGREVPGDLAADRVADQARPSAGRAGPSARLGESSR